MSLTPPVKVGKLQTALHTKAKSSPDYRFYALYDKVYRRDVLEFAYARCREQRRCTGGRRPDLRRHRGVMAWTAGWTNWRKNSGRRRIDPGRSDACTSLKRMASEGRWAFRSAIHTAPLCKGVGD